MMSFMLRRVYQGLLFKPDSTHIHPLIGLCILVLQFGFMIVNINWVLGLILIFVILENVVFRNIKGALSLIYALLPALVTLGIITYFVGGWVLVYRVLIRLLIGGIGFSLFFSLTNPSDLTRVLEKLHLGSKLALIPSLTLTIIPRIAKDAEDTFTTLRLRGELKGGFYRWLPKALAILIASIIYRSEFLAQSLYFKGFGIQKRTHYKRVRFTPNDLFRVIMWAIFVALFVTIFYLNDENIIQLPTLFF